jgi:hypothetical protein
MGLITEDGTGVANANGYVTTAEFENYCDAHGLTVTTGDAEAAIVRATMYIDACFRLRFAGYMTFGRNQYLEWPRTAVLDSEYFPIGNNEIPREIKNACCEAAQRELTEPNSLMPDLERGGQIRALQAGSVRIDYGANASATTTYRVIEGILASLLGPSGSMYSAQAVRG